jgi:hypothetical protein
MGAQFVTNLCFLGAVCKSEVMVHVVLLLSILTVSVFRHIMTLCNPLKARKCVGGT